MKPIFAANLKVDEFGFTINFFIKNKILINIRLEAFSHDSFQKFPKI